MLDQKELILLLDGLVEQFPVIPETGEFLLGQFEAPLEFIHISDEKGDFVFQFMNSAGLELIFLSQFRVFFLVRRNQPRLLLFKLSVVFLFTLHQFQVMLFHLLLLLLQLLKRLLQL